MVDLLVPVSIAGAFPFRTQRQMVMELRGMEVLLCGGCGVIRLSARRYGPASHNEANWLSVETPVFYQERSFIFVFNL